MGWNIGIPSLKLNNVGKKSKHCGSFAGVAMEALEERKGRDPDINPELAHLNIYEGITSAKELMEYSQKHVQELSDQQRAAGGRKIRDDAVVMCSTIIKPPAEMMVAMSRDDQVQFLRDAADKLSEIVGDGNVKSKAFHFDEQGGHLHVLWEPITEDGRLCAKELHNLKFFGRLNREMPAYLRSKGWDIDDCQAYDAAKEEIEADAERAKQKKLSGRSSAVFKRDMEQQARAMRRAVARLQDQLDQTQGQLQIQEQRYAEMVDINEKNLEIIRQNERTIAEQTEILQLIQDYDEYLEEAEQVNDDLGELESLCSEMPKQAKPFHQAAANAWLKEAERWIQRLRRLIENGIRRLKIFEKDYGIENPLSVPAEKRKKELDAIIGGAGKRAQEAAENAPERKKKEASWE